MNPAPKPTNAGVQRRCAWPGAGLEARVSLAKRYRRVRQFTEFLCETLETEDYVVQSMPDVSPTRWHLAHTTWFFETLVLLRARPERRVYNYDYAYLFNSYYNTLGPQYPQPRRGLLSRPTVKDIYAYRAAVDEQMGALLAEFDPAAEAELARTIETGLHHEQQHQELMLMDIKHVFSCNPLNPVYRKGTVQSGEIKPRPTWIGFDEELCEIGYSGDGFAYDNEKPRHRAFVAAFEIADRLVTNGEYMEFMSDGGYRRPELWLSDGWARVQDEGWQAPLYWERQDGEWWNFTLSGMRAVEPAEPVTHISHYEADAYARWAGARLPTEAEWELAAACTPMAGNFVESGACHPTPVERDPSGQVTQLFGDVWEWTSSPYVGYPGYQPPRGALGEYNGKFMSGQMVLRGGSCVTSQSHVRPTYRNFFHPHCRWQFGGLRLGRSV